MHKNSHLKNKYLFISNFKEVLGKNSMADPEKIMYVVDGVDVLDYNKFVCYITFSAQIKFNYKLKINQLSVNISNIELKDENNNVNINMKVMHQSFISLYVGFKKFVSELKGLISDLDFLNKF